jgi:hypothetical protein
MHMEFDHDCLDQRIRGIGCEYLKGAGNMAQVVTMHVKARILDLESTGMTFAHIGFMNV